MKKVGSSIITSPTPGAADLHMMLKGSDASSESLLYIPVSAEPALSTDFIRLDRLPRPPLDLDYILKQWLAGYQQFAGYVKVYFELLKKSDNEFLLHAGFHKHPVIGAHHTAFRYLRTDSDDYGIQFIKKLQPLTQSEIEERIDFLTSCELASEVLSATAPAYTEYATKAHAHSEEIYRLSFNMMRTKRIEISLEELGSMLAKASPFHYAEHWANTARYFGRSTLDEGQIDRLEIAAQYLRLALSTLYDARNDPFLEGVLYDTVYNLAEVLMHTHSSARALNVADAANLYRFAAYKWRPTHLEKALGAEVKSVLGSLLNDPESLAPMDSGLADETRDALTQKQYVIEVMESLLAYADRIAYIARRKDRSLYRDSCLAADLTQLLLERACSNGSFDFKELMGRLIDAFKYQLEAQLGFYGLSQDDLDRTTRAFTERFRKQAGGPSLFFLRPLCTTRRIHLKNRFGASYQGLFSAIKIVPTELTLEGALHLAFMTRFVNKALGGPIDIFGMERSTAVVEEESSPLLTWQKAASSMIAYAEVVVVLLDDSAGLLWELSEVKRQGAFAKILFVTPPDEAGRRAEAFSEAGARKLRQLGYDLPAGPREPGFLLLDSAGAVEQKLTFDTLWSGELLNVVWARVAARLRMTT